MASQALHERAVLLRRQADDLALAAAALIELRGQRDRGLARRARDDDRARAEEAGLREEVVDQEAGEEQRTEDHLLVFALGIVARIGGDAVVEVVEQVALGAVGRDVLESAARDVVGARYEVRRHGKIAV